MTEPLKAMITDYKNKGERVDEFLFQEVMKTIERAERAQELERNIKLLEAEKGIKTALNNDAIKIIEEKEGQNKRYREALKDINEMSARGPIDDFGYGRLARQALEESK